MKNIIIAFKTFSQAELDDFALFLQSPIYNKNTKLLAFFTALKASAPAFKCSKEAITKKIQPKKNLSKHSWRRLEKQMQTMINQFLIYNELQKHPFTQQQLLLINSSKRGLYDVFERQLKETLKQLEAINQANVIHYYHLFLFEEIAYLHDVSSQKRAIRPTSEEMTKQLDLHYLINKLRFILVELTWQRVLKQKDKVKMLEETLAIAKNYELHAYPLLQLYHLLVLTFNNFEDKSLFANFKATFETVKNQLPDYEIRQIANVAITYCRLTVMDGGGMEFKRDEFYFYQTLIDRKAFFVGRNSLKQRLSPHFFHNVVKVGLDMALLAEVPFEWVTNFIEAYKDEVLKPYRDAVYNFAMANFHFAKGEFSKTQDFLVAIQFEEEVIDFFYTIYYKTLQIQTAFELDEWELLHANLESFRLYLFRHKKIAADFKLAYDNFRKLVHKLFNKKIGKRIASGNLEGEIRETTPLREREWLLRKVVLTANK